jgi:hypothetical protein
MDIVIECCLFTLTRWQPLIAKDQENRKKYMSLVDEVEKNKTIILGKFSDTVSNERKKKLWISIATKCSAIVGWSSQKLKCKKSSNYNLI